MQPPVQISQRGNVPGIIAAAGYEQGEVSICPGKANPGCLVALNMGGSIAASATRVAAEVDPNQAIIPLSMILTGTADWSFTLLSGGTSKTINAEGTNINQTYNPGDFTAARLFAQQNPLPPTGPVTRERPLQLLSANADAMNTETLVGTMIGIATDKRGRVPEAAVRYHLSRWGAGYPETISLCAKGYRSIGGGLVDQPKEWCDGTFKPGTIVPIKLTPRTMAAALETYDIGPLQPMVPLMADFTGSTATLAITIDDPQTGKDARIEGGQLLAAAAAAGARGSLLTPNYPIGQFVPANFQAGINAFPWTQVGVMSRERPLTLNLVGAMGDTFAGFMWALVLDDDHNVPADAWRYANQLYGGAAA